MSAATAEVEIAIGREIGISRPRQVALLIALMGGFVGLSLALPIAQETPIVDEPIFASSAFEFAQSGQIVISNLSAPNAVFDTIWGGLFARVLGETYGALRLSTIVLTGLSAPFMFLLCRNLGGTPRLAILGTAAYLFAPIVFTLSLTFQTDAHFLALILMAVAVTSSAFVREARPILWLVGGSVLVSLAFLSRPQALVVTIAAVLTWLWRESKGTRIVGAVGISTMPVAVLLAHSAWTSAVGAPYVRGLYSELMASFTPKAFLVIGSQSLVEGVMYLGFFTLPLLPLTVPGALRVISRRRRLATYVGTALATIVVGFTITKTGPLHLQGWVTETGFAAVDRSFLGSRSALPGWATFLLLVGFATSAYALILALFEPNWRQRRNVASRFAALSLLGLAGGAFISSLAAHGRILDRYWLPMVPLAIGLAVSAAEPTRRRLLTSTTLVALMALVTLLGAIDAFSAYRAAAEFADDKVEEGVDPLALDAGAPWAARTFGLNDDDPDHLVRPGPFWVKFYAVESDPEYGIVLEPLEGYTIMDRREYRSILHPGADYLYFVHRDRDLPFYFRVADQ